MLKNISNILVIIAVIPKLSAIEGEVISLNATITPKLEKIIYNSMWYAGKTKKMGLSLLWIK